MGPCVVLAPMGARGMGSWAVVSAPALCLPRLLTHLEGQSARDRVCRKVEARSALGWLFPKSPCTLVRVAGIQEKKESDSAPPSHPILPQALLTPRLTCDGDEGAVEQLEEADAHAVPLSQDVLHGVVVLRQAGRCRSGPAGRAACTSSLHEQLALCKRVLGSTRHHRHCCAGPH